MKIVQKNGKIKDKMAIASHRKKQEIIKEIIRNFIKINGREEEILKHNRR